MCADVCRVFIALLITLALPARFGFGADGEPAQTSDRAELLAAFQAAEKRLKDGDASADVWRQILETLYRLDQPQKALGAARVATNELEQNPQMLGHIARAYYRGGFPDEAAKLFDTLVALHSDPASALVQSKLLHSEGRVRPALDVALRTLALAPEDAELRYQVALLYGWLGRNAEAATHFESALKSAAGLKGYPRDLIVSRAKARSLIYRAAQDKTVNTVPAVGSFPFARGESLRLPTVQVQLNGQRTVSMLLDLGGGATLSLDTIVAQEAGIKILGEGRILDVTGGTSDTKWALTSTITLGDCQVQTVATQVYPFNESDLPGLKGVVGAGLFARKRMVVDFDKRRVQLEESMPSASAMESTRLRSPLEVRFLSGDQPIVRVKLRDVTVNAIFDIGTPVSCFSTYQMTALKAASAIRDAQFGEIRAKISTRIPFRIARRTFEQGRTYALPFIDKETSSGVGMQVDMLLGWDVFKEMRRFTIDAPARKIIIDWRPPRNPPPAPAKPPSPTVPKPD
jgi:tetratricopeptide (TPR) repeat protein